MASLSLYTKIETLPSDLKKEAKDFIEYLVDKTKKKKSPNKQQPVFGSLKGKIHMSKDFDAPIADFKDYI